MAIEPGLLKISDLERLSGTPRYTIHQYVRQGLLPEPVRTGRTMAYYGPVHLERLQAIREIKGGSRLPLAYLKQALQARDAGRDMVTGRDAAREEPPPGKGAGARRRQQIKEAAFKVFLEKGFQRARIQDITAAAGVSTGTFYIYYRDKREVFMEVIDELIRNAVQPVEEAVLTGGDIPRRAGEIARFYLENYGYFSGIINQLRGMMAEEEPAARDKFIALHKQLADPIVRGIRAAVAGQPGVTAVGRVLTMHLGASSILVGVNCDFDDHLTAQEVEAAIERLEVRIRQAVPEAGRIFIEANPGHPRPAGENH
jgi:AcrR family transcriptional regulator